MTRYITVALVLCGCVLVASAQYNNFGFGYNSYLATNFGPPGLGGLSAAAARDPRANTGPVVFPPSPSSDASQSSGVVIGASGYGFQAPNSQGAPKGSRCRSCVVYERKPTYVQYSEGLIEQRRLLAYLDWIRNIRFDRGYISNPWSKFSRYIPHSYI